MNRKALLFAFSLVAPGLVACTPETPPGPPVTTDPNAPPKLGAQIDRMGQPAVTQLLIDPLNRTGERDRLQNEYNAASDPNRWLFPDPNVITNTAIRDRLREAMGVFDGLDGICNNSLLRSNSQELIRYNNLAIVLTYDALFLDSEKGACAGPYSYLAVFRGAFGFPAEAADDCGGRPPTVDVVDAVYTALVRGRGNPSNIVCLTDQDCINARCTVTNPTTGARNCLPDATLVPNYPDGVGPDATPPSLTEFPFLAPPQ
jgi:hypothetical protein